MTNKDVQWICAPCGARYCNGIRDGHIATWHVGRCDICANETAVTEPRDFGYLKATKADAVTCPNRDMAERERREAADKILRDIRNRGVGGWVTSAIDAYFARYEKEPT